MSYDNEEFMQKIFNYSIPIILILFGLGLLAVSSILKKLSVPEWLFLLTAFLLLNICVALWGGYWENLISAWSYKKLPLIFVGLVLGIIPSAISILFSFLKQEPISIDWGNLALTSALVTFAIVCWEELWFRGVALEWAGAQYSKIGAALIFGFLFFGLHFFNPQINLIKHGLDLFLAGYTLSVAYFLFGTIWVPIGMHYSNNMLGALIESNEQSPIEGESLIYTIVVLAIAIILTFFLVRKTTMQAL